MSDKRKTTHARHDRACCLAPGLYNSSARGKRQEPFDISIQYSQSTYNFIGPARLGADDLRVSLGLIALASIEQLAFNSKETNSETGRMLASVIRGIESDDGDSLVYCAAITTLYRLATEIGYSDDGGDQRRCILASLDRMAAVTIIHEDKKTRSTMDFLGYKLVKKTGKLLVAINPLIARAIWREAGFVHFDMTEVRALKSDPARILHLRLCASIDPGKRCKFNLDTLVGYIWSEPVTPGAHRRRRNILRDAIKEIEKLDGWQVLQTQKGYQISRPKCCANGNPLPC